MVSVNGVDYDVHVKGSNARVAATLLEQGTEVREDFARLAFELGVETQALASVNGTVTALADQFQTATETSTALIASTVDALNAKMHEAYDRYLGSKGVFDDKMGSATEHLVQSLDPEKGEAVRKLIEGIKATSAGATENLVGEVTKSLNINDPNGPIGTLHRDLTAVKVAIAKLEEQAAAQVRVETVRNRTPLKGTTLETWVGGVLLPVASSRGESLDHCADFEGAIARCKTGDLISAADTNATGGLDAPVVIEAKTRNSSVTAIRSELDRARDNRCALAGLAVVANPNLVAEPIAIYDKVNVIVSLPDFGQPDADYATYEKLVVHGFILARLLAVAATPPAVREAVDLDLIHDLVGQLAATSKLRTQLKGDVTRTISAARRVQTTTEELDAQLDEITTDLRNALAEEMRKASPPAAGHADAVERTGAGKVA